MKASIVKYKTQSLTGFSIDLTATGAKLITVFDVYITGVGDTGEDTDVIDGEDFDGVEDIIEGDDFNDGVEDVNDGGDGDVVGRGEEGGDATGG